MSLEERLCKLIEQESNADCRGCAPGFCNLINDLIDLIETEKDALLDSLKILGLKILDCPLTKNELKAVTKEQIFAMGQANMLARISFPAVKESEDK